MNKDQYLNLKSEIKELGKIIKSEKRLSRELESKCCKGGATIVEFFEIRSSQKRHQEEFRIKHIFMSLVRGKTRIQIEHNFEKKSKDFYLEREIGRLCDYYEFETDLNEKSQVLKVSPKVSNESAA